MKNKIILSLVFLLLVPFTYSQYCGTATTNVTITPTTTIQYSTTYSSGRRAFKFVATAGNEYTFSTVGETTADTYLRLYSTGTGGTLLVQNDDYNNTQSEITWYCSTSGTYSVLLTRWKSSTTTCAALNANARIKYQKGNSSGGTIVSIGGGEVSDYNVPANHYYNYGWTDMIYLQSEINTVGSITKIRFQVDPVTSVPYTATNQKIYMGHTTLSIFPSIVKENAQTNYVSSDYTLVYDGTINWAVGWVEIVLQTAFPWNNTNNLLIKWENRHGSWTSDEPWFYYTSKANTVGYKVLDASYPTANGVRGSLRPNIKIALGDPVSLPVSLLSFTGHNTVDGNSLEWKTASEVNSDYFTLERGLYRNGSVDWLQLQFINGAGNSNNVNIYGYFDLDYPDDINYYRLSQTDYDGNSITYEIISIDNRIDKKEISSMTNLLGQEINENYKGMIIITYVDGSIEKLIK